MKRKNMATHYNCCVRNCKNSFRNAPELHYYRIPKEPAIQKRYVAFTQNETLIVDKESTHTCSAHEGGGKRSRTHLPSIFPWTTPKKKKETQKMEQTKRKLPMAELPLEVNSEIEEHSKENLSIDTSVEVQTLLTTEQLSTLHDYPQSCEGENMKLKDVIQRLESKASMRLRLRHSGEGCVLSMCLACWMVRVAAVHAHLRVVGMHSECAPLSSI